ncbi:MAG: S9 family peptidase [Phycisphaerae bacterium]|nr:S9 family peptidase [Phycisphaerae bacterium]
MPTRSTRLVQPDDLLRLVSVADPQLSPDGERIALVHKSVDATMAKVTSIHLAGASGAVRSIPLTNGPRDSTPRWSPDGTRLAFVRAATKEKPQVAILSFASTRRGASSGRDARGASLSARGTTVRIVTSLDEGSIAALEWSPDGTRLAVKWRRTMEPFTAAAAKTRKAKGASTPPLEVEDPWYRLDGDGYFGAARYRLHVLDLAPRSRRARAPRARSARAPAWREVFSTPQLDDFSFDWSPDGRSIAVLCNRDERALFHPERTGIVLVDPDGRAPARAIAGIPPGPKDHPRWSPDGTHLAWAGRRGRSSMYDTANVELWCARIAGSAARPRAERARALTARSDYCLMVGTLSDTADATFAPWLRWAADGRSILTRIGWHGAGRVASVPLDGGRVALHTDGSADLMPASLSPDGSRVACIRSAPTEPPEIAVAEVGGRTFRVSQRTNYNAAFRRTRRLVAPREHWVRSGGVKVHTWVLRPPRGAPDRRGAAVLTVHGGPHAEYGVAFFHEFQVLAAAGYTVVLSNPRGSKGYGARFCGAIRGRWGTADWTDVRAVTSFMRRLEGVRANRLAIMGGSYGGFMTNWAIGHSRAYRAAITDRCVSNQVSMSGNSDYIDLPDLYWTGSAWDRPHSLWKWSPIAYFKGVKTPTLIIHSEGDLRCNIEQAEQVHAALVTQGVPTRFVRYPRETSHGMSRVGPADLRLHRLREILDWWAKHLH